jgi:hypothetical protein
MVLRGHLHAPSELVFSPDSRTLATSTIYVRGFSKTEGLQRERGDFEHTIRLWPIPAARDRPLLGRTATPAPETGNRWVSHSPWTPDGRALVMKPMGLTLRMFDTKRRIGGASGRRCPRTTSISKEPTFTDRRRVVTYETAGESLIPLGPARSLEDRDRRACRRASSGP